MKGKGTNNFLMKLPVKGLIKIKTKPLSAYQGKYLGTENEGQFSADHENKKGPNVLKMKGYNHDGLYVNAEIYQRNLHCLVDTGASMSVLHSKIYQNLPAQNK